MASDGRTILTNMTPSLGRAARHSRKTYQSCDVILSLPTYDIIASTLREKLKTPKKQFKAYFVVLLADKE